MRAALLLLLIACSVAAFPQDGAMDAPRPLVLTDAVALRLSKAQVFDAAQRAWTYTFGQEPHARIESEDSLSGRIEGSARLNFRSKGLGSREATMGVVRYHITISAENGQCLVRITHFSHTGNRNARGGGVDLGTIYAGKRPLEKVPGISMGSAIRIHADIRTQAKQRLTEVMKNFAAALRRNSGQFR